MSNSTNKYTEEELSHKLLDIFSTLAGGDLNDIPDGLKKPTDEDDVFNESPVEDVTEDGCESEEREDTDIRAEYNMYQINGNDFISLEVPGFGKDDIDAYLQDGLLIIEGTRDIPSDSDIKYIEQEYPLVSEFKNKFKLNRNTKVDSVKVINGICRIYLVTTEPEIQTITID